MQTNADNADKQDVIRASAFKTVCCRLGCLVNGASIASDWLVAKPLDEWIMTRDRPDYKSSILKELASCKQFESSIIFR